MIARSCRDPVKVTNTVGFTSDYSFDGVPATSVQSALARAFGRRSGGSPADVGRDRWSDHDARSRNIPQETVVSHSSAQAAGERGLLREIDTPIDVYVYVACLTTFHSSVCDQIIANLLYVFVSIEMTGQSVQFEQKFNYRRPMYIVMGYLWKLPEHRHNFM